MATLKRWLNDPQVWAARLEEEERGLKPRRRGWARVSLVLIVGPLIASIFVPWASDMAGIQGFLLGLLASWGIWRLVEDQRKDAQFRRAGGITVDEQRSVGPRGVSGYSTLHRRERWSRCNAALQVAARASTRGSRGAVRMKSPALATPRSSRPSCTHEHARVARVRGRRVDRRRTLGSVVARLNWRV